MTMTSGSAAVPAVTMAWSVWRSAGEPPGATAKVVSSAIRAAWRRRLDQVHGRADPPSFKSGGHADVVVPRLHDHERRAEARSPSWLSMRDIGPRPLALVLT